MSRYRNFETFYKKFFLRKTSNFIKPPIIDANSFTFPLNSTFYNFKVSDIIFKLDKTIPYLKNIDGRILVKNIISYSKDEPLGLPKRNSHTELDIANTMSHMDKKIKYLRPNVSETKMMDKDLLIVNSGALNYCSRYMQHAMENYYKWYNNFETVIDTIKSNITSSDKNIFINFDLPLSLLSLEDMKKASNHVMNSSILSLFPDSKSLNLLELWKWMDGKNTTLFNKLSLEEMKRVNLLLCYDY